MLSRALLLWERKTEAEATVEESHARAHEDSVMIYGVIIVLFLGKVERGDSLSTL